MTGMHRFQHAIAGMHFLCDCSNCSIDDFLSTPFQGKLTVSTTTTTMSVTMVQAMAVSF
eukprot:m.790742 g.790742  ORF g.790742 m.790742 type:complete len:59 (+) comp23326_c0_seq46:3856-4032(+)